MCQTLWVLPVQLLLLLHTLVSSGLVWACVDFFKFNFFKIDILGNVIISQNVDMVPVFPCHFTASCDCTLNPVITFLQPYSVLVFEAVLLCLSRHCSSHFSAPQQGSHWFRHQKNPCFVSQEDPRRCYWFEHQYVFPILPCQCQIPFFP